MTDGPDASQRSGELGKRLISAIVMAALAIAAVIAGGWPFLLFWAAGAIGVFWEWNVVTASGRPATTPGGRLALVAGGAALLFAAATAAAGPLLPALPVLAASAFVVAVADDPRYRTWQDRTWRGAGVVYAAVALLAPVVLRRDDHYGLVSILFLFAVVWTTDVLGYFVGRAIGGPRLAPVVSPNKTWSGACGGVLGAVVAGVVVVFTAGGIGLLPAAAAAFVLSVASQAGDLFESFVKRRFRVKDASHIIPGHGGLMDRLDGFIAASGVAALVGVMRGGLDAPARGFLVW